MNINNTAELRARHAPILLSVARAARLGIGYHGKPPLIKHV